ncbi:MAG: SufD family Fe-S cluster assembly protein [Candidatus Micrarchaeaceae archaeon]
MEIENEVLKNYAELPNEVRELYKKYVIELPKIELNGGEEEKGLEILKASLNIVGEKAESRDEEVRISREKEIEIERREGFILPEERAAVELMRMEKLKVEIDVHKNSGKWIAIQNQHLPVAIEINVKKGVEAKISEYITSSSTAAIIHSINVEEGAELELNLIFNGKKGSFTICLSDAKCNERSKLRINAFYNGSSITKTFTNVNVLGKFGDARVNELVFGADEQKFDISTFVTNSNERTKAEGLGGALLDERSYCIMKGYAKVNKDTRGSYSNIAERGILLSKDAQMKPLPDMSINYSNEIIATHSASTYPLSEEAIFYLMSRGISEKEAREMLLTGFALRYLSDMKDEIAKEVAIGLLNNKMKSKKFGEFVLSTEGVWL